MESDALREAVLAAVRAEGFELAGIAPATAVPAVREAANAALVAGRLAGMGWMDPAWNSNGRPTRTASSRGRAQSSW